MANESHKKSLNFRWHQRLIRWAVFVCVVAGLGYAAIPWWIPREFLRNTITADLQRQLGLPVTVGEIFINWSDGLTVRDLVIQDDPEFSASPIVEVPIIRSDFSPWDFFVSRQIGWMEISGMRLAIRVNEDGVANTGIFNRLESGVKTVHTVVSDATVSVDLPGSADLLVFKLTDLQYRAGKIAGLGRLTASAYLKQDGGPAALSVRMDPGLEQGVLAAASFHFSGIDLEQLGLIKLAGLELRKLAGKCGGSLNLQFDRASSHVGYFNCNLDIDHLEVQPLDEEITIDIIERAGIRVSAAYDPYDPAGERIDIKSMSVRLPGLDMTGRGTVYSEIIQGNLTAVRNLTLDGQIEPSVISDLLNLDVNTFGKISVDGPVMVDLKLRHEGPRVFVNVQADASSCVLVSSNKILKDSDIPFSIISQSTFDERNWSLEIIDSKILFGLNTFLGCGNLGDIRRFSQADSVGAAGMLKSFQWKGQMQLCDMKPLEKFFQPLGLDISDLALNGVVSGDIQIDCENRTVLKTYMKIPAGSDFSVGDIFVKPPNQPMEAYFRGELCLNPHPVLENVEAGLFAGGGGVSVDTAAVRFADETVELSGDFQLKNAGKFLACFGINPSGVTGTADGNCHALLSDNSRKLVLDADITRMDIRVEDAFVKPAGMVAKVNLDCDLFSHDTTSLTAKINKAFIDLGETSLNLSGTGEFKASSDDVDKFDFVNAGIDFNARMSADNVLFPLLKPVIEKNSVSGVVSVAGEIKSDSKGLKISSRLNGNSLAFAIEDYFEKASAQPLSVLFDMEIPQNRDRIRIRDMRAVCDNIKVQAGGTLFVNGTPQSIPDKLTGSEMHVSVESPDAAVISKLSKRLASYKLGGGFLVDAQWDTRLLDELTYVTIQADSLSGYHNGRKVEADGDLTLRKIALNEGGELSVDGIKTDTLSLSAGNDRVWITGQVESLMKSPRGRLEIAAGDIDMVAFSAWFDGKTYDPSTHPVVEPYDEDALIAAARKQAEMLREYLAGADLSTSVNIASIRTWDPSVSYFYDTRMARVQAEIRDAKIDLRYSGGVSGGAMHGGITIGLEDDKSRVSFWKNLNEAFATDAIRAQMFKYFPGNEVKDLFTRQESGSTDIVTFLANSADPRYKLKQDGRAITIAVKGETAGRAAPKFVTRLFPGLNFTRYYYRKMTSFGREYPDGSAYSDMIFDGESYDVYIEGTTDPDNIARYDVGVILVGTPQTAEWNHIWKQGRLPLFKVKAKIKDGKFEDMTITYPWPNESLGTIFIKNNILYRAWLKSRGKATR